VLDDVSLLPVEPDDIVDEPDEDVSVLVLPVVVDDEGLDEAVLPVVPLAPMLDVPELVPELALGLVVLLELVLGLVLEEVVPPLAPMLDVVGLLLFDWFTFAPPAVPPPEVPEAPEAPEPDWATATPPMARAAAAASVVRIFLDMSLTP
jgi:hypothetical protein